MVLHLETGTCESGVDCEFVAETARMSTNMAEYHSENEYYPLQCASCDEQFRFLSGLLQHVESDRCEEILGCSGGLDGFQDELEEAVLS